MHLSLGLACGGGCTFPAGGDVTSPVRVGSPVIGTNGLTVTITYNETLDPASVPTLSLTGTASVVSSVNVTGSTVVGTLDTAALMGETITVSSSGSPIQDAAGNDAAALSSVAVTNNSSAGSGTPLLAWSDAQTNRQHDASMGTTYHTAAAAYALASADTTRLEDMGDGNGALLLCEGQRACINIQSRTISGWTNDNSATSTADTHVSPDGGTNADSVTFAATTISGKSKTQTAGNVASSVNLAWQCWAKSGTGGDEKFKLRMTDKSAGTPATSDLTVNQNWQRYTWDVDSGAGVGAPVFRLWNASDAVSRGAGRVIVVASVCVEAAAFPSSLILNEAAGQNGKRYEDLILYTADMVPLQIRSGKWASGVRPKWANTDLISGDIFVLLSFGDSSNVLRFRHTGTDVRLEAVVGGSVVASSVAVTVARNGYLPIVVDCAAGVLTVGGVAGSAGSPIVWPGGVPMRVGGVVGGGAEAFASIKTPAAA